jgi:hypothetical protein
MLSVSSPDCLEAVGVPQEGLVEVFCNVSNDNNVLFGLKNFWFDFF